ncbi:MAG: metallophosphoesterase family protein [Candidatus Acidiferrum sp.]
MLVAAIYDIHGNLPALEAVLEDVARAGADQIVVGGDVVPGPLPRETLERLLEIEIPVQFIKGNGEAAVLAEKSGRDPGVPVQYREAIRWNAAQLRPRDARLVAGWPETLRIEIAAVGKVLFCHATPQNYHDVFTCRTPEDQLVPVFAESGADVVVCGHTHMQFDRRIGDARVVNAGSVGMPFGMPGAYWLLLGSEIEFRRTDYDLARAAARIRMTQYPRAEEFAARNVLHPASEEEMLTAFAASQRGAASANGPPAHL